MAHEQGGDAGVPDSLKGYNLTAMLEEAYTLLDCGVASALKQAASDGGIAYGTKAMEDFVVWGQTQLRD